MNFVLKRAILPRYLVCIGVIKNFSLQGEPKVRKRSILLIENQLMVGAKILLA